MGERMNALKKRARNGALIFTAGFVAGIGVMYEGDEATQSATGRIETQTGTDEAAGAGAPAPAAIGALVLDDGSQLYNGKGDFCGVTRADQAITVGMVAQADNTLTRAVGLNGRNRIEAADGHIDAKHPGADACAPGDTWTDPSNIISA